MPFTPSHAVVALPFIRTPLVPAAIAVGAMAPDLPLFVRGTPISYAWTHDLRWLPVTVLLAFALFVLWRYVFRPATTELAPNWLAGRFPAEWDRGWAATTRETFASVAAVALLAAALVIGVTSHVVWDLFTHEGRGGVEAIPALDAMWGPLPGYKWLQHGSSAIGLLVLAIWAGLWVRRTEGDGPPRRVLAPWVRVAWWVSLPGILVCAVVAGYTTLGPFTGDFTWQHLAYAVLPPACAVWAAVTLVLCGIVLVARRRMH